MQYQDCKLAINFGAPKVVLLSKFSLYRAPIVAGALRLQPHQPHG